MYICYVDESGDTATLHSATAPIAPAFVIAGIIIHVDRLRAVTTALLEIKRRFFPGNPLANAPFLDTILREVKGERLRRDAASRSRRRRTHAIGFLDHLVRLLSDQNGKIIGRVWIKNIGIVHDSRAIYTSSVQAICTYFESFLAINGSRGLIIADSREKTQNAQVAHSIFTQIFKQTGNEYPHIVEMPTFGHSENHAGLQLADALASGLLFPMALHSYCHPHIHSHLIRPLYNTLNRRFGPSLGALQYLYRNPNRPGHYLGGITVADMHGTLDNALLFQDPHAASPIVRTPP